MLDGSLLLMVPDYVVWIELSHWIVDIPHNGSILGQALLKSITGISFTSDLLLR